MMHNDTLDPSTAREYDTYWEQTENSYPHYPTIRHRKRFIMNEMKRVLKNRAEHMPMVFDFGCGEGSLLMAIQTYFSIPPSHLEGSDISAVALERAREKIPEGNFLLGAFPKFPQQFDICICSEVIEHTPDYRDILEWIHDHLTERGTLLLTTQTGRMHASDHYTRHTQHFQKTTLENILREIGFHIEKSRLWGWPFFTLQKYMTDLSFDHVRNTYLEGELSPMKRFVFNVAYLLYFFHDLIPSGPQIYIVARKS